MVSTPIGNLRDITLRALDVLSHVDLIAAEDTRKSRVLLNHYQIKTPLKSYHDFNKERITPFLINELKADKSVAVITDAGTPGISDPAFYFVRQAISEGIRVEAIPGPTAFVPALVVSGLATDRFVFEGFLPPKKGRLTRLQALNEEPRTIIIYESPKRLLRTLNDLLVNLGNREAVVARELSKKFEEIKRGLLADIIEHFQDSTIKGEIVILVSGMTRKLKRTKRQEFKN